MGYKYNGYFNTYYGECTHKEIEKALINVTSSIKDTDGYINAAYISNEGLLESFLAYQSLVRGLRWSGCNHWYSPQEINKENFRGPDWYFIEGFPEDRDGPGEWWLETLAEKKQKFEDWCKQFEVPN